MGAAARDEVGSVAEEAAALIGLLRADYSPEQAHAAGERAATGEAPDTSADEEACASCGGDPGPRASCRGCPVCRVLGVVRAVSPDALDRIADLVDLVGDGLRSYAAHRRDGADDPSTSREQDHR